MAKWDKRTLKLPKKHGWHAKPGYKIFVADRGAVRFDFPDEWVVIPDSDAIKFHDKQPPDDDCTLALSVMRLPPGDWSSLKLSFLVAKLVEEDDRRDRDSSKARSSDAVHRTKILDLAWAEVTFIDQYNAEGVPLAQGPAWARGLERPAPDHSSTSGKTRPPNSARSGTRSSAP